MSIAARARTAAARAAPYPAFAGRFDEPAGYAMRMKVATTLACLLGIDPVQVTISDDTVRRYAGRYVWPLLEVAEPDDGATLHIHPRTRSGRYVPCSGALPRMRRSGPGRPDRPPR